VELFLRIEQLLGHKIPVYEPNKESVMVMMERVTEAQRIAKLVRTCAFILFIIYFVSSSQLNQIKYELTVLVIITDIMMY